MKDTRRGANRPTTRATPADKWTDEELAAMKEHNRELKVDRGAAAADGEAEVLQKIAEMPEGDRAMATRVHAIVMASAPQLTPRTWYGMPAYARDGKVICFFQQASKFKARYSTLGFNDGAMLDDGSMWPTSFALTKLTAEGEKRIGALVKKAAG